MPSFLKHNSRTTQDFSLLKQDDLSLVGEYKVKIRADIEIPDDYTKTSVTLVTSEHEFNVIVQSCKLDSFTASKTPEAVVYQIGQPGITSGTYAFEQKPACGYEQRIVIENLPDFATHNAASGDFTIPQTVDLSILGQYSVTVRAEIDIPSHKSGTPSDTIASELLFEIQVNPCEVNEYSRQLVPATIFHKVGAAAKNDGAYSFKELPECGYKQTVTVSDLPSFVTHNQDTSDFTIQKVSDLTLIGEYKF